MDGKVTVLIILIIAFFVFIVYFIIKQIGFFINATRLYRKIIKQQKIIVNLLIDIRDNTKNVIPEKLDDESDEPVNHETLKPIKTKNLKFKINIRQEDIDLLKQKVGNDATNYAVVSGNTWLCVCGTENSIENLNCSKCHRNRNNVLKNYTYEALHPSNEK